MKHYYLTVYARNRTDVDEFYLFYIQNIKINFNTIKKYFQKNRKKKVLTLLTSPHIDKTAQEQFEYRYYSKNSNIYTTKNNKILLFLKKIKLKLFYNIKIKLKFKINKKLLVRTKINLFNPINFKLNIYQKNHTNKNINNFKKISNNTTTILDIEIINLKQINKLIKVYDIFGEFSSYEIYKEFNNYVI